LCETLIVVGVVALVKLGRRIELMTSDIVGHRLKMFYDAC
jgi:hypothetical protein